MVFFIGKLKNAVISRCETALRFIQSWQEMLYSMVLFASTMVVMFWISVFLYSSFYFTYMPPETLNFPVHFHYSSCGRVPGICSNPVSSVYIMDETERSNLLQGQRYRIVLDLEMPESPSNQRVGMFQVSAELKGDDGFRLHKVSRSVMLRYKSKLLQNLSTMIFAPLLLYGTCEEKQILSVELFDQYEEKLDVQLMEVLLEIESRHVEIYSARLRVHAMFSGVRYLMYHYPLLSAVVGVGTCMFFLAIIVIFSWYQMNPEDDRSPSTPIGSSSLPSLSGAKLASASKASSTSSPPKISVKGTLEAGTPLESPDTCRSSDADKSKLSSSGEGSSVQEVEKSETGVSGPSTRKAEETKQDGSGDGKEESALLKRLKEQGLMIVEKPRSMQIPSSSLKDFNIPKRKLILPGVTGGEGEKKEAELEKKKAGKLGGQLRKVDLEGASKKDCKSTGVSEKASKSEDDEKACKSGDSKIGESEEEFMKFWESEDESLKSCESEGESLKSSKSMSDESGGDSPKADELKESQKASESQKTDESEGEVRDTSERETKAWVTGKCRGESQRASECEEELQRASECKSESQRAGECEGKSQRAGESEGESQRAGDFESKSQRAGECADESQTPSEYEGESQRAGEREGESQRAGECEGESQQADDCESQRAGECEGESQRAGECEGESQRAGECEGESQRAGECEGESQRAGECEGESQRAGE